MSDLIKQLENWAKRDTVMSEFGPDEHIAGMAAKRIEKLEAFKNTIALLVGEMYHTNYCSLNHGDDFDCDCEYGDLSDALALLEKDDE